MGTSGTRGPLDFVEFPSHLMEYFSWDERVLGKFAKHAVTGAVDVDKARCINHLCARGSALLVLLVLLYASNYDAIYAPRSVFSIVAGSGEAMPTDVVHRLHRHRDLFSAMSLQTQVRIRLCIMVRDPTCCDVS